MQSSPGSDAEAVPEGEPADELTRARSDRAAAEERYLRARADLENYRKRSDRELERRVREQVDAVLRAWLEVVDTLDRAVALDAERPEFRAFLDQVESILARQGVRRLGRTGDPFDPELHEAIAVVPGDDTSSGTVADVARSGFAVGDRVIRPAQVAVARSAGDGA
jgi:molecular chaperone GrpE